MKMKNLTNLFPGAGVLGGLLGGVVIALILGMVVSPILFSLPFWGHSIEDVRYFDGEVMYMINVWKDGTCHIDVWGESRGVVRYSSCAELEASGITPEIKKFWVHNESFRELKLFLASFVPITLTWLIVFPRFKKQKDIMVGYWLGSAIVTFIIFALLSYFTSPGW